MSDVTVFGAPASTYVRTARPALEEKGVAHDLAPALPGSAEMGGRHPFDRTPALARWYGVASARPSFAATDPGFGTD